MDASTQALQSYKQKVWEKINFLFHSHSEVIYKKDYEITIISSWSQFQVKNKLQLTFKCNSTAIIIEATPLQKISDQFTYDQQYFLSIAQKMNKGLTKDEIVFWVENDHNFAVKKIVLYECLKQTFPNIDQFFRSTLLNLKEILKQCKTQALQTHLQIRNKISIQNRFNLLEHLKFQFEVNRRQREKTTSIDFNNCKIKCVEDMLMLKETCSKQHKNYMVALREQQLRTSVNGKQALNSYGKIVQAYKKRKEQQKFVETQQQKQKILNPIKIRSCKQVNQQLQGTFSHIQVVQSQFSIIFSLNLKTTELICMQQPENASIKNRKSVLVRKKKCQGCCSCQCEVRKKINQSVFENEKQMLILLNPYSDISICSFYVEQYAQRKQIKSIYSQKLPTDPISRFLEGFSEENPIKSLKYIIRFLTEVAEGVQFLSSHEALHRDLKPTNVLLDSKNSAKIIDFGSSCPTFGSALEKNLTKDFDMKLRSTKGYYRKYAQLPGQVSGKYLKQEYERHTSFDIYSLGAIAEFFIPESLGLKLKSYDELKANVDYLIKKCKDIHPDDRITALQAAIFLKQLTSLCQKLTAYN